LAAVTLATSEFMTLGLAHRIIFRPSFAYEERREAWLKDWARRFWQGSTDHRGVPEAPGGW
jgi:cation transport regulator ChaC